MPVLHHAAIAPGLQTRAGTFITAARCLPGIRTDTVHILFGYEIGHSPKHVTTLGTSYRHLQRQDIAGLCDLENTSPGLTLADSVPEPGTRVTVQGYGSPKAHVLQATHCAVLSTSRRNRIRLNCPLPSGTSGAPIMLTGSQEIVGVVSASSAMGSFSTWLSGPTEDRLCK